MKNFELSTYGVQEMNSCELIKNEGGTIVKSGYSTNSNGEYFWWMEDDGSYHGYYTTLYA